MRQLSLSERHNVQRILDLASAVDHPPNLGDAGQWLRLMRKRLRMTQRQLAKRAGVPQSSISRIECGQVEPSLSMIIKLFTTLFCEVAFLPIPMVDCDRIIEQQARKAAERKVKYLEGTMALEEQQPEASFKEAMVEEETQRLIRSRSSEIWE